MISERKEIENINLEYTLYEENIDGELPCPRAFSIKISADDGKESDERCFSDIARDEDEARRLFGIISDGLVTPESAEYVIEELLFCY